LFVGVLQHSLDIGTAAKTYTLLTIGDGLVAQIPALIISIAAGMVVTRVGDNEDVSQQFVSQLFNNPRVLISRQRSSAAGPDSRHAEFCLPALGQRLGAWPGNWRSGALALPSAIAVAPRSDA
jgi:hypothetical protein